jgi:hypothetical protein
MDIDAKKTPRTYDAWKKAYDVQELAKFMVELSQQLEFELNIAILNETFAENKAYMLEKELKEANERIKRLDETLEAVTDKLDGAWGIYMEFKEPKP